MRIIFMISLLALILFGFFMMDKLDRFMASPYFFPDRKARAVKEPENSDRKEDKKINRRKDKR